MLSFLEESIIFGNIISNINDMINISEKELMGGTTSSSETAINTAADTRYKDYKRETDPSKLLQARADIESEKNKAKRIANTTDRNKILATDAKNKRIATEINRPGGQDSVSKNAPVGASPVG